MVRASSKKQDDSTQQAPSSSPSASLLLSSDTLSGYGLDLIFQTASALRFDGLDLAMWKNFDAWHIAYVQELVNKYTLPIHVIQISRQVNIKEMNQAVDLARAVGAEVITINSPKIFNIQSFRFLKNHLPAYKVQNKQIKFAIINPVQDNFMWLIPKYYFSNIVEIIKKHKMYLGLDVANIDEQVLEHQFLKRIGNFMPYLLVAYLSDVARNGDDHLPLGEGILKLASILKKFKQQEYEHFFSLKVTIAPKDLADIEKVKLILQKSRNYYKTNYEDLLIW
jgi:sugar phosphate isomerase/epimerase